jgi:hypothetical protein
MVVSLVGLLAASMVAPWVVLKVVTLEIPSAAPKARWSAAERVALRAV